MSQNNSPLYQRKPYLFGLSAPGSPETLELAPKVYEDFLKLKELGLGKGIQIEAISTWRSFEKQKQIWNSKACGQKVLLDNDCLPLEFGSLSSDQVLAAILRWSALPGLSRHHWGTDLDVYDEIALKNFLKKHPSYEVQLTPREYEREGPFEKLGEFLDHNLTESDFFRPYEIDRGGVAQEPWHLSHISAVENLKEFTLEDFKVFLASDYCADIILIDLIKEQAQEIFKKYHLNVSNGI